MSTWKGGLVSQALREALGTLMSQELTDQVIGRALALAGYVEIPETGPTASEWFDGVLKSTIADIVGSEAADVVTTQLRPIVAQATRLTSQTPKLDTTTIQYATADDDWSTTSESEETPSSGPAADPSAADSIGDTVLPPPRPRDNALLADLPSVLVASSSFAAVQMIREQVRGWATLVQIPEVTRLLKYLDDVTLGAPLLILDMQHPTMTVATVLAVAEDLPNGTIVVLWGAPDEHAAELNEAAFTNRVRIVRCSEEAAAADVGSLCAMLLTRGAEAG